MRRTLVRWLIAVPCLAGCAADEPSPIAPDGVALDAMFALDLGPVADSTADVDAARDSASPDVGEETPDARAPTPDAAPASAAPDVADPWPDPEDHRADAVSVVVDGRVVPPGGAIEVPAAPAGLADVTSVRAVVTNRSDQGIELPGAWLEGDGFALAEAPLEQLAPTQTFGLIIQFSAVEMTEAGTRRGTLRVPGQRLEFALVAEVPAPLRTVVVGDRGLLLVSDDYGASFRVLDAPDEDHTRHAITWGNGRFFRSWAAGSDWGAPGRYAYSDDGERWTGSQVDDAFWASGCAWGLDRFVCAVSDSIAWSQTGAGVVHEARQWGPMLHALMFAGGRFVAVGRELRVAISDDGLQWTGGQVEPGQDWLNAVADAGDFWVAGGGEERTYLMVSRDRGDSWTHTVLPESGPVTAIAAHDGLVLVATRGPADTLYSTRDGRTWDRLPTPDWTTYELLGVANGWFFAAVNPWQQPGQLVRSRDGRAWSLVFEAPEQRHLRGMAIEGAP